MALVCCSRNSIWVISARVVSLKAFYIPQLSGTVHLGLIHGYEKWWLHISLPTISSLQTYLVLFTDEC